MDWLHPSFFVALIAIPIAIAFMTFLAFKNRETIKLLGKKETVQKLIGPISQRRRRWKAAFIVLGLIALVTSLAGPRFGTKLKDITREGADLIIALDLSKSMHAQDVGTTRLTKAKFELTKLIDQLQGDRVGLVFFAGDAYTQCPLTLDYSAAKLFLDLADVDLIPNSGTDFSAALQQAMRMFNSTETEGVVSTRSKALLIISDGENHVEVEETLKNARDEGIVIYTGGIGETEGVPIPEFANGQQVGYKKDSEGQTVVTKLEEAILQELAQDGGYFRISKTTSELPKILGALKNLNREEFEKQKFEEYSEQFQWPLGIAIFFLAFERIVSDRARRREEEEPEV